MVLWVGMCLFVMKDLIKSGLNGEILLLFFVIRCLEVGVFSLV